MNKLIFPNRQFEVKNKVGESYTEKKSLENYKAGNGKHTFNNPHACLGFPFSLMISVGDESIDALQLFFFFSPTYISYDLVLVMSQVIFFSLPIVINLFFVPTISNACAVLLFFNSI